MPIKHSEHYLAGEPDSQLENPTLLNLNQPVAGQSLSDRLSFYGFQSESLDRRDLASNSGKSLAERFTAQAEKKHSQNRFYFEPPTRKSLIFPSMADIWAKRPTFETAEIDNYQDSQSNGDYIIEENEVLAGSETAVVNANVTGSVEQTETSDPGKSRRVRLGLKIGPLVAVVAIKTESAISKAVDSTETLKFKFSQSLVGLMELAGSARAEKGRRHLTKYALGAVAVAGLCASAYAAYKYNTAFGTHANNMAEKAHKSAELASLGTPAKPPAVEHATALHSMANEGQNHSQISHSIAYSVNKPQLDLNRYTWDVAHHFAPGKETNLINKALQNYGHGARLLPDSGQIQLGNGRIVNPHQMREINEVLYKIAINKH